MRRTLICGAFVSISAIVLAFAFAEEFEKPSATIKKDPLDQLLADFTAATAKLDIEKAERLFLPPDDGSLRRTRS